MPTERRLPRTADGDRFRFRGGRPSLDFCSTLLWRRLSPFEQLCEPGDLSRWLLEADLCSAPCMPSDTQLSDARALRESLYRLFRARLAGRPLQKVSVGIVNAAAAKPPPRPQLGGGAHVTWLSDDPIEAGLAAIARDGIELLSGPLAGRVRECAADDCAFLFLDTSRPGRRRWCATNRCGNRQHVRDHRARTPRARRPRQATGAA